MINEDIFMGAFAKVVNQQSPFTLQSDLEQLDDYDSLTQMSVAAWISDNLNKSCSAKDLAGMQKVSDVFNFINT